MTGFKERILTTMQHEEPDRVPVMGLIMDPATVNQILERKPTDLVAMLEDPEMRSSIQSLLDAGSFWEETYYGNFAGALESAIKLGFDANWAIYSFMQLEPDPESAFEETPGEALYKLAEQFREQGDRDAWEKTLRHLIERYPSSRFAVTAEADLQREGDN